MFTVGRKYIRQSLINKYKITFNFLKDIKLISQLLNVNLIYEGSFFFLEKAL